eukprot:749806-Hanusia_phi.AAC.10
MDSDSGNWCLPYSFSPRFPRQDSTRFHLTYASCLFSSPCSYLGASPCPPSPSQSLLPSIVRSSPLLVVFPPCGQTQQRYPRVSASIREYPWLWKPFQAGAAVMLPLSWGGGRDRQASFMATGKRTCSDR